jgi:hypothetical protein
MSIEAMKRVLRYDSETGEFWWTAEAPTKVAGKLANAKDRMGYVCLKVNGKMHKAHRLAWAFVYGEFPEKHIDHINGDPSDNRLCNLRLADRKLNMQNQRRARSDNATGVLGVRKNGSGYRAEIRVDGKRINLGTYPTTELAHIAYVDAKRKHHEGCTR